MTGGDLEHSSRFYESQTLGRLSGFDPGGRGGEKALWLSGGGYRSALFHLGALTRLNELGLLARIDLVGAVAGGSILAAVLATGVSWPLRGAFRDWPEQVAEPMRAIARRNARARALLSARLRGRGDGAALEERYARELARSLGGEPEQGPNFVFGASGLTLSGLAGSWEGDIEWEIGDAAGAAGYNPGLVAETIAAVRTDLDAHTAAEQAVLENHGYLLADAAARERGLTRSGGIEPGAPDPPHPEWMSEGKVREALAASSRRTSLGRLRSRRGSIARAPEPASEELTALLRRHRPLLHYDSLEPCRADSAATICSLAAPGRCNALHRADGALIAAVAPGAERPRLSLDFLGETAYPNGEPVERDDYLDQCGGAHAMDAIALRRDPNLRDVAYGRARHDGQGRLWLQYWLFYYWEDRGLLGIERREGDWEMVQLLLGEDGWPEAATFAQHGGARRLDWDQVELADSGEGPALVVYPARGSHASLPHPGTHPASLVPDHNDGLGPRVRPRLEPIGDDGPGWALWPGRWGSTRRRESFEADSPRGPREWPQWWDPAEMHREARPWRGPGTRREDRRRPPRPSVEARREGEIAVVSYRFPRPGSGQGEPARMVAAPYAGDHDEACEARSLAVDGEAGSFAIPLPFGPRWEGIRLCTLSSRGVAGATVTVDFA